MSEHKPPRIRQKQSRINNTLHLWEFLLELLEDERYTTIISWTRKEAREFKIKRQEDVARKWGRLKQRTSMNYDKLSRALRYYYHKGIIKKVQGQRLVYKFDKLPYSYKPVRYNWPWKLPNEEHDLQLAEPDFVTTAVSKAMCWPVMPAFKDPNTEEDVKPVKPDIGTPLVAKRTHWPVTPELTVTKEEQNVKSVKQTKIPPLISVKAHSPVTPPWNVAKEEQDIKHIKRNNIPPLISMKTHSSAMPACKVPKMEQIAKTMKAIPPLHPMRSHSSAIPTWKVPKMEQVAKAMDAIPPLHSMRSHSSAIPTWKVPKVERIAKTMDAIPPLHSMRSYLPTMHVSSYGIQSPICSQSLPRNPDSELSGVGYQSRPSSQAMCRSQIIFPPCSCMRSVACGMRMLPDPPTVPVQVITRFV